MNAILIVLITAGIINILMGLCIAGIYSVYSSKMFIDEEHI
jgi:hypothetical protein